MAKRVPFSHAGDYFYQRRLAVGLTQAQLAEKLSSKVPVHSQFVSNWERGLCMPPSHSLNAVIKILKCDRETLVQKMLEDQEYSIRSTVFNRAG